VPILSLTYDQQEDTLWVTTTKSEVVGLKGVSRETQLGSYFLKGEAQIFAYHMFKSRRHFLTHNTHKKIQLWSLDQLRSEKEW
jgi:hypothetical protein